MKVKKLIGLMLGCAAVMSLASCGGNATGEAAAVEKAKKASICSFAGSGTPILAETETHLSGDQQDALKLTTKQATNVEGTKYSVDIEWSYDTEAYKDWVKGIEDVEGDETHKKMSFNYPTNDWKAEDPLPTVEFKATLKCGSATGEAKYTVTLDKINTVFDELTIAEINAVKDSTTFVAGQKMFALQTDDDKGYMSNHGQKYYYVRTSGKLIYVSPDKNWGLLADGKNVVQLYQIAKCSAKDEAVVGRYLTIEGNMGNGYGNLQLSYITKIEEMKDPEAIAKIADPVEYGELPEDINEKGSSNYLNYAGDGEIPNSIVSLTNVTFAGTDDSKTQDLKTRFTFSVTKGSHTFKIAYDYHVYDQAGGTSGLDAWKDLFKNAVKGVTKFNLKGTCRYANDDGDHGFGKDGGWTITPFAPEHWTAA